jgi:hypothetical protein
MNVEERWQLCHELELAMLSTKFKRRASTEWGRLKLFIEHNWGNQEALAQILKGAAETYKNQPKMLLDVACYVANAWKKNKKYFSLPSNSEQKKILRRSGPLFPWEYKMAIDWHGWDLLDALLSQKARISPHISQLLMEIHAIMPPLSHWATPALFGYFKQIEQEPGLTYHTFRQRLRRCGLRPQLPLLVKKFNPGIELTEEGLQWVRERELLALRQKKASKVSHDKVTKLRVNSSGETPGTHLARSRNGRSRSTC